MFRLRVSKFVGSSVAKSKRQQGVSLIELMISLTLSLFLILAAIQMYLYTKQSTRSQEAASRIMENGRAATEFLNRSVRMARYFGCAGVDRTSVTNHYDTSTTAQTDTDLNGYDQQGLFGYDQQDMFGVNGTTDEIIVYRAEDEPSLLAGDGLDLILDLNANEPVLIPALKVNGDPHEITVGDMIAITNCTQADIFNISALNTGVEPDQLSYANCADCTHRYLNNSVILPVTRSRFYITNNSFGVPSLFVTDPQGGSGTTQELVEGVENMQISYGRDTDDDGVANQYISPAAVKAVCTSDGNANCWKSIASVRIALLLRSIENNVVQESQTYTYNGASVTATDKRLRREFLTIIALRNYRI